VKIKITFVFYRNVLSIANKFPIFAKKQEDMAGKSISSFMFLDFAPETRC